METTWAFWSDYDIDGALILNLEDISEIIVSEDDGRRALVESAAVKITRSKGADRVGGWLTIKQSGSNLTHVNKPKEGTK